MHLLGVEQRLACQFAKRAVATTFYNIYSYVEDQASCEADIRSVGQNSVAFYISPMVHKDYTTGSNTEPVRSNPLPYHSLFKILILSLYLHVGSLFLYFFRGTFCVSFISGVLYVPPISSSLI
jgi:hypothetical protein